VSPRASGQPHLLAVVATVAVGGVVGAEARYGLAVGLPHAPGAWAWSTLIANVTGCLLIGVLMVLFSERIRHPLVRPLLGVGVLGGYTTFSTFSQEIFSLLESSDVALALTYAGTSVGVGLLAVYAGTLLGRAF
jgi:fluoride exporter